MTDNSALAFADTETTGLHHHRRIWNIGLIRRYPDGTEIAEEIIIRWPDLTGADPRALSIGHFWARHPQHGGDPGDALVVEDEHAAADWLMARVRPEVSADGGVCPLHIVGAVPNFDVEGFAAMFARHNLCWPAHYHLLDAENIALGALAARGMRVALPYTGEQVSELLGLDTATYARHTALGDARWARDLYDAAMLPAELDGPATDTALRADPDRP
ncbi:MAG: hypothetical protein ACRDTH_24375 [Pseudonocardiaceae bacterium]